MNKQAFLLKSEKETTELAYQIAGNIKQGDILTFSGGLGAGKTFLCRHIIKKLCGQATKVTSPTFNLLQIYELNDFEKDTKDKVEGRKKRSNQPKRHNLKFSQTKREVPQLMLYHFDLYRLKSLDEIYELGIEEAFSGNICLIEWPEIISNILPKDTISIKISIINKTDRLVTIFSPISNRF